MSSLNSTELQKLYIAFFGRPCDPSGMNYWQSKLNEKVNLVDIAKSLSIQDEYKQNFSNSSSVEFKINQLYSNLFSRKADFDSLNYWSQKIKKDELNIYDLVLILILKKNDKEKQNNNLSSEDFAILEKKVKAAELFTDQISTSISWINLYQPESINPWILGKALQVGRNYLNHVDLNYELNHYSIYEILQKMSSEKINVLTKPIIKITNLSLTIPIAFKHDKKLSNLLTKGVLNSLIGGQLVKNEKSAKVEALSGINLTIMNGERVALIGHNGSGKTSFLKIISGIYMPTQGELDVKVEVYPMLQKSFLTSTDLTGIDAAKAHYLLVNKSLNGFEEFLEDIIDFSGLGEFISLPIKTYSEGMSARLIFSILTSIPHDCLAIDEGFGTGDTDFFDRAEKRMKSFMNSSGTLILASHSEYLLKQFCTRGIVFNHGSVVYDGSLDAALNYYHTHDYLHSNDN
tara:strand:- start:859 stop:2238 length:1380 start_codon:yes stop_codon:yes gene_type:complete